MHSRCHTHTLTHTHTHTHACPLGSQKCQETHHGVSHWLKMEAYSMKQELLDVPTTGHSIQSTAVALRRANSHHKPELQGSSAPPTAITPTQSHNTTLLPGHHYVRLSCLKATRSIWKRQKVLARTQCRNIAEENVAPAALPRGTDMFVCSGADHPEQS